MLVVLISCTFLLLSGCGIGSAPTSAGTSGGLTLSAASLDFGSISVGSSASKSLNITNSGTAPIGITGASISGNYFSFSGLAGPVSLAPSQVIALTVKFSPTAAGVIHGSLVIATDSPASTTSVALAGTAVSSGIAQLSASPSTVAFGSVAVGSTASATITLANVGSTAAYVSTSSFSGPGFTVSGLSTPFSLSSGQSTKFSLAFSPTSTGAANGSLLLKDSSGATLLNIAMSGSGVSPSTHSVDLNWQASTSNVTGYRVYRGTVSGGPYSLLTSSLVPTTTFRDASVLGGYTYYYVVTAVDLSNLESGYSNEVVATIPTP